MRRSGKLENAGGRWTLPELCHLVEEALAVDYVPPQNGQVRAVPNERTVRYYSTLGILDRPAEMQGRTAYYGRRHLQQLVALKRLQAEGLALPEIQGRLLGLTDERLEEIARLPKLPALDSLPAGASEGPGAGSGGEPAPRRDGAFWEEAPAPLPPPAAGPAPDASAGDEAVHGVALDERAWLLLRGGAALDAADRAEVREAAAPLIEFLRKRGWLKGPPG